MKRQMTRLEEKILNDVQLAIWKYYDSQNIEHKEQEEVQDTIIDFFSYLYRLIPQTNRRVHYSEELLEKIELENMAKEHIEVLKKYEDAFKEGKNMNIFLSNNITKLRQTDYLRYAWHLFHLHMSGKFVDDTNQMKNNRSDTQLLCIISDNDVYFVDVIPHPIKAEEYFNINSLKIIVNNGWMEKLGFTENQDMIPGTLQPKITQDKDIFELYSKAGINMSFEFEGKGYTSLEPMGVNRRPFAANYELSKINREICNLNSVEGAYKGFQLACDKAGKLVGLVEFELRTGEIIHCNIL